MQCQLLDHPSVSVISTETETTTATEAGTGSEIDLLHAIVMGHRRDLEEIATENLRRLAAHLHHTAMERVVTPAHPPQDRQTAATHHRPCHRQPVPQAPPRSLRPIHVPVIRSSPHLHVPGVVAAAVSVMTPLATFPDRPLGEDQHTGVAVEAGASMADHRPALVVQVPGQHHSLHPSVGLRTARALLTLAHSALGATLTTCHRRFQEVRRPPSWWTRARFLS